MSRRERKSPGASEAPGPILALSASVAGQAAPAMYLANRPQLVQRNVTCARGSGGIWEGSRSMGPEQDGHLSGVPARSLVMRWSACAGLYVFGRGLRMTPPDGCCRRSEVWERSFTPEW